MAPFDPRSLEGLVLEGRYRVEQLVGAGGHGFVFRAQHLALGTAVAIKLLRPPTQVVPALQEAMLARLRDEGRVLHALSRTTPAVVQALDVFSVTLADGTWAPCLVMEWLDGVTLEQARERRQVRAMLLGEPAAPSDRLSAAEALRALSPLAEALGHAHAAGIAHRDVKPSNVMIVGHQPAVKLLDFGIAKVMSTPADDARAFEASGKTLMAFSPAYAAPEQVEPGYGATGPWTDVFALALLVVELIAGQRALGDDGPAESALRALDPETRPTPRTLGVATSDAVEAVLRRALVVDPRNRPRTADAFWSALRDACADRAEPLTQPPITTAQSALPTLDASQPRRPASPLESATAHTEPPAVTERAPDRLTPPRRSWGWALVAGAVGATAVATTAWLLLRGESEPGSGTAASGPIEPTEPAPTKAPSKAKPKPRVAGAACPPGTQAIPGSRTCLDELEVTVAAFDAWAGVAARRASHEAASVCTTKSDAPVNCVSFRQATDFCLARSQRLPTEGEWKRAATDWLEPSVDLSTASARKRSEPAAHACAVDRTTAGICGLAGGVSELVTGTSGGQCVLGPADDSGASAGLFRECRMPGWSADDAGSSCGFRCATDLP